MPATLLVRANFDSGRYVLLSRPYSGADNHSEYRKPRTPSLNHHTDVRDSIPVIREFTTAENFNDLLENVEICNRIQATYPPGPVPVQKAIMALFHSNANVLSQRAMGK